MGYFANGSELAWLDEQCEHCKLGQGPCPVYQVQIAHNYEQNRPGNELARTILSELVNDKGNCQLWARFPEVLLEEVDKR